MRLVVAEVMRGLVRARHGALVARIVFLVNKTLKKYSLSACFPTQLTSTAGEQSSQNQTSWQTQGDTWFFCLMLDFD